MVPNIVWRILLVVICVLAFWALVPPLASLLQMPISANVHRILVVCVAVLAVCYIIWGRTPSPR